jgi:hypothetical protein
MFSCFILHTAAAAATSPFATAVTAAAAIRFTFYGWHIRRLFCWRALMMFHFVGATACHHRCWRHFSIALLHSAACCRSLSSSLFFRRILWRCRYCRYKISRLRRDAQFRQRGVSQILRQALRRGCVDAISSPPSFFMMLLFAYTCRWLVALIYAFTTLPSWLMLALLIVDLLTMILPAVDAGVEFATP